MCHTSPTLPLDALVDNYHHGLTNILNELAPEKIRIITDRRNCAWYTSELRAAKQSRRAAERKWRKTGLKVHRDVYTSERNSVNELSDQAKEHYYRDVVAQHQGNTKLLFRIASTLLDGKSERSLPSLNSAVSADMFSKFFTTKISNIQSDIPVTPAPIVITQFVNNELHTFTELSPEHLHTLINQAANKHCDLDPMPTHLIKSAINDLAPLFLAIINTSLHEGQVPWTLKQAIVSPRLKKASLDKENMNNYRPISNLPFLSKVLERAVADQLMTHLHTNSLHEVYQSAYRPSHSTETALLKVHDDITQAISRNEIVILVMIDLSAAFDTVDHQLLLRTLDSIGVTGRAQQWFAYYLHDRSQTVIVDDSRSKSKSLSCGVPQGSVLGPILFNIYTASLGRLLHDCGVRYHMYADDTQIYLNSLPSQLSQAVSIIETCLSHVRHWMNSHRLKMNDSKTEVLYLSSKRLSNTFFQYPIGIGGSQIMPSKTVRNIGVTFDSHLDMETHVSSICRSAYIQLKRLSSIRRFLDKPTLECLVHAFVTSRLDYCNTQLCGITQAQIHRLQRVQNSAARLITRTSSREHITPILYSLHWLPVKARIRYKLLLITYKCVHDLAPSYLQNLIEVYLPKRDLRSNTLSLLTRPFTRSHYCQNSAFSYVAPMIWNSLPNNVRCVNSISIFKSRLKTFLFNQYYAQN